VVWTQSGDFERGAALINMSLQADQAQPIAWANLGNAQLSARKFEAALSSFERSIVLDPRYAPAHNGRGSALSSLERHELGSCARHHAVARGAGEQGVGTPWT
jgi:Flp pilus assembly protein TadD